MCQKYNLIETGGSDCHGSYYGDVNIGAAHVPYSVIEKMKKKLK
jgi:hypothetical protein